MDDAGDVNAASPDVDHEQHVVADQADEREHLDGEEVCRSDCAHMRLQERLPRHSFTALRRGLDAALGQDAFDCVATNHVTNVTQCTANPRVAPRACVLSLTVTLLIEADLGDEFG